MPATKADEPGFVRDLRRTKADRLARAARISGLTAVDVVHLTDEERREIEAAAAVKRGSDATWRLTADMLAGSSKVDALCPTCGIGDPEGIDAPPQPYNHGGPCSK